MTDGGIAAKFYPEIRAGGYSRVDSTIAFYQRVSALLQPASVVLDFGAGRGADHLEDAVPYRRALRNFKGKVREVIGADVDPVVTTKPSLDRALVLDPNGPIALPDRSVDLILSDFTFEHVDAPERVAAELDRILVPGGWICARTPNRYGYIAIANRLVPQSIRMRVLRTAQQDRKEQDVFPAVYRLNSRAALQRCFDPARFDHVVYSCDPEPAYHANSALLYRLFLGIHALSPPALRTILLIFLQKRAG
jgi:SAM-dependent methyltransferase